MVMNTNRIIKALLLMRGQVWSRELPQIKSRLVQVIEYVGGPTRVNEDQRIMSQ